MYIYNYIHIWRAARNVKNPPANNYVAKLLRPKCFCAAQFEKLQVARYTLSCSVHCSYQNPSRRNFC